MFKFIGACVRLFLQNICVKVRAQILHFNAFSEFNEHNFSTHVVELKDTNTRTFLYLNKSAMTFKIIRWQVISIIIEERI